MMKCAAVVIVCLSLLLSGLRGQVATQQESAASVISRAMKQSRTGAWREGVVTVNQLLQRKGLSATRRAEALSLLAACHTRLGQNDEANAAIAAFDKIADQVPADSWSLRSMARLRGKPAPRSAKKPALVAKSADLATRIWTVRQNNSIAQYGAAASSADEILKEGNCTLEQRCDLLLHLAYARHHLKRGDAGDAFAEFVEEAAQLSPNSRLLLEMQMLRESLKLPPLVGLPAAPATFEPKATDDYWAVVEPATVGFDDKVIKQLTELVKESGADAFLVTRGGKIALEYYSALYREPMRTMSSCKSITGLLAGMLIERGKLKLDDKVGKFVPAWREGQRAKVTVRHLLTMTAGLPRRSQVPHVSKESWTDYALRQELVREPGSAWAYTNEGVQLLSPILEDAAGMPLWQFAERELFAKVGASSSRMRRLRGVTNTFADTETTLREFARFGELVRRRGNWPGAGQVVGTDWLDAMVQPCEQAGNYGFLWWVEPHGRGCSMRGYLDTNVWVFPDLDIVVARVQQRAYLHATKPFDADRMYDLLRR